MRFLLGYLMIGFCVGVWSMLTLHMDSRFDKRDLFWGRLFAIPAQMIMWPVELVTLIWLLLSSARR